MTGTELTSVRSPRIQAARRLNKRAFRAQERRFLAEGPQAVREAVLRSDGRNIRELFATRAAADRHPDVIEAAGQRGIELQLVSGEVMSALCQTVTPQGMVAVCDFLDSRRLEDAIGTEPRLVAVLADARDPGNVGTVIRAADAAGADAVVLAGATVDPYNGKCVRATAGSLFHVPIAVGVPAATAVAALRSSGLRVLAADGSGSSDLHTAADRGTLDVPTAWIFGNEAWGLPPDIRALADEVVRVPIYGRAESLNLAAAAAVCLYASARAHQRGAAAKIPGAGYR